jgi:hypothetical protein
MNRIHHAINIAGNWIKKVANQAGEFFNNLVGSAGEGISDLLILPGKTSWYGKLLRWLASMLKGVADITGALIKVILNITGGVIAGIFEMAGGLFFFRPPLFLKGLLDIFSPVSGTLIVISTKILSLIQSMLLVQAFERKLAIAEHDQLYKVFRGSIRYKRIRIIEGRSGLFGLNARAFTLGNTIYLKKNRPVIDLLVHECTHIWQYQNLGVSYSSDALGARFL